MAFFSQESCSEVIFSNDTPFKRLDHYKLHEYTRKWNFSSANNEPVTMTLTNSIDAMFKRKRGRPPKNRVIEVRTDFKGIFHTIALFLLRQLWIVNYYDKSLSNNLSNESRNTSVYVFIAEII